MKIWSKNETWLIGGQGFDYQCNYVVKKILMWLETDKIGCGAIGVKASVVDYVRQNRAGNNLLVTK